MEKTTVATWDPLVISIKKRKHSLVTSGLHWFCLPSLEAIMTNRQSVLCVSEWLSLWNQSLTFALVKRSHPFATCIHSGSHRCFLSDGEGGGGGYWEGVIPDTGESKHSQVNGARGDLNSSDYRCKQSLLLSPVEEVVWADYHTI